MIIFILITLYCIVQVQAETALLISVKWKLVVKHNGNPD